MKNYDYWKSFVESGRIDDYLHYIACTKEDDWDSPMMSEDNLGFNNTGHVREKEGGFVAGIDYRNGNGSIGHASW
ncbi:MAG: hypothetical protein H6Q59_789 [Firmicutes bacterium]|nr:hypothetical protein [Bacillota bacterium]